MALDPQQFVTETEHKAKSNHGINILFVLKYRDNAYGCDPYGGGDTPYSYSTHLSSGLLNSARLVVEMLAAEGYNTKLVQVVDNNQIHREIVAFNASICVIEAFWVVPEKFDVLYAAVPKVQFVIRNHSDLAFLSNEGSALTWTLQYLEKPNVWMSCNSAKTTEEVRFLASVAHPTWSSFKLSSRIPYLPNYYPTDDLLPPKPASTDNIVNIGCFGAIRPLKNQLVQAVAALKYASTTGQKLRYHINGTRVEGKGEPILKNLIGMFSMFPEAELVMHNWLSHDDFLLLIRQMDCVMQVSFSETFNIIAADAVVTGVPIVVSSEVPWAPLIFQASTGDVDDMVAKMTFAIHYPSWFAARNPSLTSLDSYDDDSIGRWDKFLQFLHNGGIDL